MAGAAWHCILAHPLRSEFWGQVSEPRDLQMSSWQAGGMGMSPSVRFLTGASCFLVSVPDPWRLGSVLSLLLSFSGITFHDSYLLRNNTVDPNHSPSLFLSSTSQSSSSENLPGCLPLFCSPRMAQQTLFQGVGCLGLFFL